MDRILIILKKENGPRASSAPALGLNTIIFKHVYWYMQQTQVSVHRTIGPLFAVTYRYLLHGQNSTKEDKKKSLEFIVLKVIYCETVTQISRSINPHVFVDNLKRNSDLQNTWSSCVMQMLKRQTRVKGAVFVALFLTELWQFKEEDYNTETLTDIITECIVLLVSFVMQRKNLLHRLK